MKFILWCKSNKWLVLLILIGAVLRLIKVDHQSVWLDEIFTLNQCDPKHTFSEIYKVLIERDPHPPLYYFTIHFLFKIFGYSTFVMRTFSAVAGIGGIVALYFLGKELMNKRVGLIAAALLVINYFHLYYSQEARMYSLLFLTTTLSFYYLVKLIKNPTLRQTVPYIICSSLMIYTHFFALFTFIGQYAILLFFILRPYSGNWKVFLKITLVSGIATIIAYIPALIVLFNSAQIKSIWIQMPAADVYTQIIKEFFGFSEFILFILFTVVIYYFMQLYRQSESREMRIDPVKDRQIFAFYLFFMWIFVTLIIPLIVSYINLPMIVSRYFINILPAILLIFAIGIDQMKSNVVKMVLMLFLIVFSANDILVVKKYYDTPTKTQFKQLSKFIAKNNSSHDPVITELAWYFPFFFKNEKVKIDIYENTLDNYVSEMSRDTTKIRAFWYANGHIKPYAVNEQTQKFLDEHFTVENNVELFDCWARHYVPDSGELKRFDISQYKVLKQKNGDDFMMNIEKFDVSGNKVHTVGWAFFENDEAAQSKYEVLLIKDGKAYKFKTLKVFRGDNTTYFKSKTDVSNSGFDSTLDIATLPAGNYQLGIYLVNKAISKEGLILTDKTVVK